MNCKPGDRARVVRPYADRSVLDLYVSVVRKVGRRETVKSRSGEYFYDDSVKCAWLCEAKHPSFPRAIADECLRPLRDNPGNEWFFKAAPLDAKQPDRGVTIDSRGEIA